MAPIDFTFDVAFEHTAHDIVGYTVLLRDVLKGAVGEFEQKKFRAGLGTPRLGIVPIRALSGGHNALAIPATITLGAQAEDHGPTTQRQVTQFQRLVVSVKFRGLLATPMTHRIALGGLELTL